MKKGISLLVITPYVIDTEEDNQKIVDKKLKEREEFAAIIMGAKLRLITPMLTTIRRAGLYPACSWQ